MEMGFGPSEWGEGGGVSGALDLPDTNGPRLTSRVKTLRHTLTQINESTHTHVYKWTLHIH